MKSPPAALREQISGHHLPQIGFAVHLDRWQKWTGHLEGAAPVLGTLPAVLDRSDTSRLVETLAPGNLVGAFIVAMIWGHGSSGYGPYRTARVLTGSPRPETLPASSEVLKRLGESVDVARRDGPVPAYRFLNNRPGKVEGLGPAFFTKWIHFVTARGKANSPEAAPVLDALIIRWLNEEAGVALRAGYTDDYFRYIELLRSWGAPRDLSPAAVEERIFRLIRGDGS